ncbi:MFS transporter [Komagataeibacter xylinus]|uniref:MFS transporter n=1 Tax=Komagataeibacter xylinus TaxID=28448 RepID=UPI00102F8057|nr:MFS transporter [Komagataeibacter xylinus]
MMRIIMLSMGAFVWLVTEVLPIGLLTDMAAGLHVSPGRIGLLVTGYAWLVALTAIPLTLLTSGLDRRMLMAALLGLAGVMDIACAFVTNYALMAAMRVALALGHGIFWSTIAGVAVRLAPHMPVARATAWAFTGVAVGFAGGIPMAAAIGQWLGWRAAFMACGIAALAVMGGVLALLPPLPSQRRHLDLPALLRQPVLRYIAVLTTLVVSAHFTAYTYIIPLLSAIPHAPERLIPLLLLIYGVVGIGGNWLGGHLPWSAGRTIGMAMVALMSSHVLLVASGWASWLAWVDMAAWGIIAALINLGPQSYAIELAPHQREAACSFCVTGFNSGIGAGALCGGVVLSGAGPYAVLAWSAGLAGVALLALRAGRHYGGQHVSTGGALPYASPSPDRTRM